MSLADDFDSTPAVSGAQPPSQTVAPASPPVAAPPGSGYAPIIQAAAQKYNVDPKLLGAMVQTESSGRPAAVSNKGAVGLMQIEPSNYQALGITDPKDPTQNIMGGAKLMSQLLDRFGDVPTALLHYTGGDDTSKWGVNTHAYPLKVLGNYQQSMQAQPAASAPATAPAAPSSLADQFDATPTHATAPKQSTAPGMPTAPMNPVTAKQNGSNWSDVAEKGVGNVASSVIGMAGAGARLIGANDFADQAQAARQQIEQKMAADTNNSLTGKVAGVVGSALPYATLGGASIPGAMAGGAVAGAIPAIADNKSGVDVVRGAAGGAALGLGGNLAAKAIGAVVPAMGHLVGVSGGADSEAGSAAASASGSPAMAAGSGRGSVGAAGTSFAQQATAEGVPDAITAKIAAAEKAGTLNPTAAGRHIEAGSLPVPVELTAGQASGDVQMLSNELNSRAKNPELANRFNAQNGQLAENLNVLRDQVSPNVNVPSGAPTGQALVDAYKQMDAPITQQISELYGKARSAEGAPALVDAATPMKEFAAQVGPTRFNALPANVQQIFRDASANQVSLPAGFEQGGSNVRPMNVGDLMDIDKTLSGAMRSATDGTVRHDIGTLRDSIVSSNLDPSTAGSDAFAAYKTAQASARARFQAMDADPAYKAAVNDSAAPGEPSPLADDFVRKYIAGGKTSNVQNMMQNLSNDPVNQELVASGLMDHLRAQSGIDLRTGSGNISQAGLNKAIQNLGDKTRIVLGPDASQTVEKLGNVARYTQEQPRGSYVNNSNTAVTLMGHAGSLAKATVERGVNAVVPGAQLGSWARESLANRANAKGVARSLEPGAGLSSVPLNQLLKNAKGNP